jgi:predicted secreted protein
MSDAETNEAYHDEEKQLLLERISKLAEQLRSAHEYLRNIAHAEGQDAWIRLNENVKMSVTFYAREGLEKIEGEK